MKKPLVIGLSVSGTLLLLLIATAIGVSSLIKGSTPAEMVNQRILYESRRLPGGEIYRDVLYQKRPFNRQGLDIYMPAEDGTPPSRGYPAVVFVHGGSWMHGSKEDIRVVDRFLEKMRKEGWAVISIDYVTHPLRLLEGPSKNVARAFDWIHDNAADYGIDPWNMGIYSVSAGSHLTMEAMLAAGDPGSRWRFWLEEIGPMDLVAMAGGEAFEAAGIFSKFPPRYLVKHSPLLHVEGPFPPTAIAHGDADRTVALAQSERLAEVLTVYGTPVTLTIVAGGDHGFFNKSQAVWEELENGFIPFMRQNFRD